MNRVIVRNNGKGAKLMIHVIKANDFAKLEQFMNIQLLSNAREIA